jgi:hypothetical protein
MNKRMSGRVLVLIGCLFAPALFAGGSYGGGTGTAADPYRIWTYQDMNSIGDYSADWNKCFVLMADIDMSLVTGTQYRIIDNFRGTFDGNGFAIRNFSYISDAAKTFVGLFSSATNAIIKNLGIVNLNLSVNAKYVGGLAGLVNDCTITNCYCIGTISDSYSANELSVGMLVGYQNNGTITGCYSAGTVLATMSSTSYYWNASAGGLVGQQYAGTISDCHSHASVTATSLQERAYAGGLVGYQYNNICNIVNSYSTGDVSAINSPRPYAGGLVGCRDAMTNSLTTGCFSTGTVTASSTLNHAYAGGLIGYLSAPITNCYATGGVHCSGRFTYTGGLLGYASIATVTQCSSTGALDASAKTDAYSGGLAGYVEDSTFSQCYSRGMLITSAGATAYIGSMAGLAWNTSLTQCYCVGSLKDIDAATVFAGGAIGYRQNTTANACFWDTVTTGWPRASDYAEPYSSGMTGGVTSELQTALTFINAGWDFNEVWTICEGTNYPRLQLQIPAGDLDCPDGISVEDLNLLATSWLLEDCGASNDACGGADLNASGAVDLADFAIFAGHWMEGN